MERKMVVIYLKRAQLRMYSKSRLAKITTLWGLISNVRTMQCVVFCTRMTPLTHHGLGHCVSSNLRPPWERLPDLSGSWLGDLDILCYYKAKLFILSGNWQVSGDLCFSPPLTLTPQFLSRYLITCKNTSLTHSWCEANSRVIWQPYENGLQENWKMLILCFYNSSKDV